MKFSLWIWFNAGAKGRRLSSNRGGSSFAGLPPLDLLPNSHSSNWLIKLSSRDMPIGYAHIST